jgi:ubiquinone/menaquinone biosynthesis C-methylase UbiE
MNEAPPRTGLIPHTVRLFLELLYTRWSWAYDAVAWMVSFGKWRTWQQAGVRLMPAGPILELGHGPGHCLRQRLAAGQPVVGLDRSRQMGRIARRRLRKQGVGTPLVRAEAQALPFAAESFDGVLATFPSEYILDRSTLREAGRVLRPGTALVVVAGVRIAPHGVAGRLLALLYRISGETPPAPEGWGLPAEAEGLALRVETIASAGADVYRLTATKRGR